MPPAKPRTRTKKVAPVAKPQTSTFATGMKFLFAVGCIAVLFALIWKSGFVLEQSHSAEKDMVLPLSSAKVSPDPSPISFKDRDVEVIGVIPDGWKLAPANGITAKTGAVQFTGTKEVSFVVPAYQIVPDLSQGGVYVLEPGRENGGTGTIPEIISKCNSSTSEMKKSMIPLSNALEQLRKIRRGPWQEVGVF